MLRASAIVRKPALKVDRIADTAWLDHQARRDHHAKVRSHGGVEFSLDLDESAVLNDGDAVKLDDGRLVQVRAAPERLLEVRAENPLRLLRVAWGLGGMHAAVEIAAETLYVQDDAALAEFARGQGCLVTQVTRPFHPERAEQHVCDHDHGGHHHGHHHHDHHHAHGHEHAGHEHGASCGGGHHKHEH
jgi:urease accessory protein